MSQSGKTESGWFSRLFGGGISVADGLSDEKQSSSSSPPPPSIQKKVENAKQLIKNFHTPNGSPRNITVKTLKSIGSPVSIIQKTPIDKRKRQHLENGSPSGPVEDIFSQRAPSKRFCGSANLSLVEEPIRITVPERLDITWAGDRLTDASPASSVRSLRSRLSGQASTASSGLSSKTRAILQQLERVHTPAKESRRLPVVRTSTTTSERWTAASAPLTAPRDTTAAPPPLRKIRGGPQGPTRLQMLANHMGIPTKKTYLKDLHRPTMKERDEAAKQKEEERNSNGDLNGSRLCPIFEMPNARASPKKASPEQERRHKVSVLKGTDGISRNVFNTKDLEDDEERNPLPVPKSLQMPMATVPQKGFLGDLSFTFELPKERTCNGAKINTSFEEQEETSDNDESDTTEPSSGEVSDVSSECTSSSPIPDEPKQKTPELKKVPEVVITGPKEDEKPKKWDCSECWASNDGDKDKCACCQHPKGAPAGAPPAKKELVNTFKPTTTSTTVTFGVGATSTASTTSTAEKWNCSVCCVDNTGDKCVCCETPRGSSGAAAAPAQKTLVSNLSSFKPSAPVSFGFGSGPAATSTPATSTATTEPAKEAPKPLFGITSTDKPAETATTPKISFGMTASSSSPNLFGAQNGGAPKITFGAPAAAPAAPAPAAGESWDCQTCFLKSTGDKCSVCGTPKEGSAAPATKKELVSNLSSFAPSAPVKFGFGASSAAPAPAPAPVATTTPAVSTTTPATPAKTLTFGMTPSSSSPSLFDASKKENGAPATTTTAPAPLFGTTTSIFGSTPAPTATTAAEPAKLTFGAPASSTEAPKPLFGSSTPLFGAKPADKPTFGTPASSEAAKPLFSSTEAPKPMFGAATTTEKPLFGSTEAPKPLFGNLQPAKPAEAPKLTFGAPATSTEAPKLTFGAPATSAEVPKPLFGSTPAPGSLFGQSAPSAAAPSPFAGFSATPAPATSVFGSQPAAPAFGAPAANEQPAAKKPMFGGFNTTAPTAAPTFGGSSANLFGQSNPAPSTGFSFGAPAAAPAFGAPSASLTTSASAGSLFAPSGDAPTSFQFGNAAPAQGNQPFVFGQASPFGSAPAPGGGAFAYNATTAAPAGPSHSGAARKIAQARRRMPGRR